MRRLDCAGLLGEDDEDGLSDVLGVVGVVGLAACGAINEANMAIDQAAKGVGGAIADKGVQKL